MADTDTAPADATPQEIMEMIGQGIGVFFDGFGPLIGVGQNADGSTTASSPTGSQTYAPGQPIEITIEQGGSGLPSWAPWAAAGGLALVLVMRR